MLFVQASKLCTCSYSQWKHLQDNRCGDSKHDTSVIIASLRTCCCLSRVTNIVMVLLWSLLISGYFCNGTGLVSPTGLCEAGFYCSGGTISPKLPTVSCACDVSNVKCHICGTEDHKVTLVLLPCIKLSLTTLPSVSGTSGLLIVEGARESKIYLASFQLLHLKADQK